MTSLSGKTVGFLGGGQLARMMGEAAKKMGCRVVALEPGKKPPVSVCADEILAAPYTDISAAGALADHCDCVIPEFENVDSDVASVIEETTPVCPSARALYMAQDREREKRFFTQTDVPVTAYYIINGKGDLAAAAEETGFPAILKTCRFGYDGKGQVRVTDMTGLKKAFDGLKKNTPLILEAMVDLAAEVSVLLARGKDGQSVHFPVAENRHENGILDVSIVPNGQDKAVTEKAILYTKKIADALDLKGLFCVEYFVTKDGDVLANEMAPRVHNSGHYTLSTMAHSQFELAVLAALGAPLPEPSLSTPAAGMLNLLGRDDYWAQLDRVASLYADKPAYFYDYGKKESRTGRKMGHVSVTGNSRQEVEALLMEIKTAFYGSENE